MTSNALAGQEHTSASEHKLGIRLQMAPTAASAAAAAGVANAATSTADAAFDRPSADDASVSVVSALLASSRDARCTCGWTVLHLADLSSTVNQRRAASHRPDASSSRPRSQECRIVTSLRLMDWSPSGSGSCFRLMPVAGGAAVVSLEGVFRGVGRSEARGTAAAARGVVADGSPVGSMTLRAGDDMGLSKTSARAGPEAAAVAGTGLNPVGRQEGSLAGTEEQGSGCGA